MSGEFLGHKFLKSLSQLAMACATVVTLETRILLEGVVGVMLLAA